MRKSNIFAIISAVLLLAAVSCTSDNLPDKGDNYISMNISSKSLETKGTMQGEDPFNENLINSMYYFFYKDGEDSAAPILKGHLKELGCKSGVRTEEIPVASGFAATLFESSDKCRAFIVANPPQELESYLEGGPALKALRAKLFQSSLDGIQDCFTMIFDDDVAKTAATGNIMTVEAKLRRLANKFTVSLEISEKVSGETEWSSIPADATIEFHNAFKETSLGGNFATVKAGDSNFKTQYFNTAAIEFGNPVQDGDIWKCNIERPVYSYSMSWDLLESQEPYLIIGLPWKNATSGEVKMTYYKVFFNAREITINNWCHLTVELDRLGGFHKDDPVQIFENMEYQVLNWNEAFLEGSGIVANIGDARYLMMNQTEYWIYDHDTWNFPYTSSHECEIVMETYEKMSYRKRYAETISGNSRDLGSNIYNCTLDGSLITFFHKMNNDFSSIETIDGINYGAYDVVPYTFKLTIRHKDNYNYKQEVIVHQYPAIYIEAQPNSAGVLIDPGSDQIPTSYVNINPDLLDDGTPVVFDESGNQLRPPYNYESGNTYDYWRYYGYGYDPQTNADQYSKIGNSNGNMYVITTASAPTVDGVQCMLADPREYTSNITELRKDCNEEGEELFISEEDYYVIYHPSSFGKPGYPLEEEDNDIFEEAPSLYGDSPRTLTYYYPTKNTRDAENIIAPKLRVASSWGQTYNLTYDKAVRRCAAYQEDGYPAGRWRVPTKAEVMYICKLSSDHVIPQLFGKFSASPDVSTDYWCSTGKVSVYKVEEEDGTFLNAYHAPEYTYIAEHVFKKDKSVAVRCVYDEWYWENREGSNGAVKTTKGRLPKSYWGERYWGDMPR